MLTFQELLLECSWFINTNLELELLYLVLRCCASFLLDLRDLRNEYMETRSGGYEYVGLVVNVHCQYLELLLPNFLPDVI